MISINTILKENKISKYSVLQALGKNPGGQYGYLNNKLAGTESIKFDELKTLCDFISQKTGEKLEPTDVAWEPKLVYLK